MCTICTFQFFGSVISFVCNLGFVKMQKMCGTICKEVKTQSTGPIISTTPFPETALLFSASIGSRMGEGESPTARNNTDDGTAIVLHWLCIVHRSQNQGDKKGILAETFRSTKQYWHGKIAVNTLFSNIGIRRQCGVLCSVQRSAPVPPYKLHFLLNDIHINNDLTPNLELAFFFDQIKTHPGRRPSILVQNGQQHVFAFSPHQKIFLREQIFFKGNGRLNSEVGNDDILQM